MERTSCIGPFPRVNLRDSLLVVGCAALVSTSCSRARPVPPDVAPLPTALEHRVTPDALRADLERRWAAMTPASNPDQLLVHQGMPTASSLVLWAAPPPGAKLPAVKANEGSVEQKKLGNAAYRIEVTGLRADTEYEVAIGDRTVRARTAPADGAETPMFSFVTLSCNAFFDDVRPFEAGSVNQLNLLRRLAAGEFARDESLPARPAFGIGLGDQIYVDEGPYSFFEGSNSDKLRFAPEHAEELLDILYRFNFAVPPVNDALAAMPTVMIWDDHEIRDGWGSHGDEGSELWQTYFNTARSRFQEWEAARNPGFDPGRGLMDFQFSWGRNASFFMMDNRSERRADPSKPELSISALGQDGKQMDRIRAWLTDAPDDEPMLLVLGTAIPLAISYSVMGKIAPEFADDLLDGWHSEANRRDADMLVAALVDHFKTHPRHRLLVLSGDVHESGVFYYEMEVDGERKVFGHEVVSSGITSGIPGPDYLKSLGDLEQAIGPDDRKVHVTSRASMRAPSFAEVVVRYTPEPEVGVIFYTSGNSKNALINWAAAPMWSRTTGAAVYPEQSEESNHTIMWLSMQDVPPADGKAWMSFFVPGTIWDYGDSLHGHSEKCTATVGDDDTVKYDMPATHWYEVFEGADRECEPDEGS